MVRAPGPALGLGWNILYARNHSRRAMSINSLVASGIRIYQIFLARSQVFVQTTFPAVASYHIDSAAGNTVNDLLRYPRTAQLGGTQPNGLEVRCRDPLHYLPRDFTL